MGDGVGPTPARRTIIYLTDQELMAMVFEFFVASLLKDQYNSHSLHLILSSMGR